MFFKKLKYLNIKNIWYFIIFKIVHSNLKNQFQLISEELVWDKGTYTDFNWSNICKIHSKVI